MNTPQKTFRLTTEDRANIATLATAWAGAASTPSDTDVIRESLRRAVASLTSSPVSQAPKKNQKNSRSLS